MDIEEQAYKFCPTCITPLARQEVDGRDLLACPHCPFVFWNNPKPCASAIIVNDEKVLMLKRARDPLKGYWCLPGGFMNTLDTAEGGAIREALEETGLTFTPSKLVGIYKIDEPRGHHLDIVYVGIATGELKTNPEEHTKARYFALNALPDQIGFEQRRAIADWQKTS